MAVVNEIMEMKIDKPNQMLVEVTLKFDSENLHCAQIYQD